MKQQYITPETLPMQVEAEHVLAGTRIDLNPGHWMQYDGSQLRNDIDLNGGKISGPASEYVGTPNEINPVNEDDIFGD